MAERTVTLRIGADVRNLRAQLGVAQRAMDDFASKAEAGIRDNAESVNLLSDRLAAVGTVALGVAGVAVARFAEFDKAMSRVQAATHATSTELEDLREAAVTAGAETAFSAAEAAGAIEQLAKAGVSTADILGGGLDGALALAAAGGLDVADAAETAASAMVQFDLAGTDVSHIADLLAAGAGKAQGSVSDLGQALNQSGLIAAQTGLTIEETTAALASFASAGLLGSDAGTSFKTMLQVLAAPTATAKREMDKLGISAYDAQGNFVGLAQLAGQLRGSMEDLTPAQRNAALATIFGSDAVRAANVLYKQGADGIREWTTAVNDQGYAAETAALMTDNLIGDLERLGGSLDSVFIQSGSGANDALRGLVQGAENLVDAIGRVPEPVLNATTLIAGAGGLALLGVAGLGRLTVSIVETRDAMKALGITSRAAKFAVAGVGTALGVATAALTIWLQSVAEAEAQIEAYSATLDDLGETTKQTADTIADSLSSSTKSWVDGSTTAIDLADKMGIATEDLVGYILGEADAVERVDQALGAYIKQGNLWDDITASNSSEVGTLRRELDLQAESLSESERRTLQAAEAKGIALEATGNLTGSTDALTESTDSLTGSMESYVEQINATTEAQRAASEGVLSLRDAQRQAEAAYDDARAALKENGATLDITTEKGRKNQAALDGIVTSGRDVIDTMRENGATQSDLQGAMKTTRDRFIALAEKMGLSSRKARDLADEMELIPKNVKPTVNLEDNASAGLYEIRRTTLNLPDKTVTVTVRQIGTVTSYDRGDGTTPYFQTGTGRALGGAIYGGVPGKDSVPIMAMPGEHMLDVGDVQAMGGQEAVYRFRQALHSGQVQQFATGGAVETRSRQFVMPTVAPSFTAPSSTSTTYRSITVNNLGQRVSANDLLFADRVLEMQDPGVTA